MEWDSSSIIDHLSELLDEVHDRYFWIDAISYNGDKAEWTLRFADKKKGPFDGILRINGVTECVCEDIAGTGLNSINTVSVDLATISINCNAPAKIELKVTPDFRIEVI